MTGYTNGREHILKKIDVMEHFYFGGSIISKKKAIRKDESYQWEKCLQPTWNWDEFEYLMEHPFGEPD